MAVRWGDGPTIAPRTRIFLSEGESGAMLRFRQMRCLQKFAAVHASVHNHFNQESALYGRQNFKLNRAAALAAWRGLFAA